MACGPGSPELSKSNLDMASKLFTFTFTLYMWSQPYHRPHAHTALSSVRVLVQDVSPLKGIALTTFVCLFTMTILHVDSLQLHKHAAVDKDHVDRGSQVDQDVPC